MFIFFTVTLMIQICFCAIAILGPIICEPTNRIVKFSKKMFLNFKWNGLIAFFNESYLLLCFCTAINLYAFKDSWGP